MFAVIMVDLHRSALKGTKGSLTLTTGSGVALARRGGSGPDQLWQTGSGSSVGLLDMVTRKDTMVSVYGDEAGNGTEGELRERWCHG